jgi:hypothetical protein
LGRAEIQFLYHDDESFIEHSEVQDGAP